MFGEEFAEGLFAVVVYAGEEVLEGFLGLEGVSGLSQKGMEWKTYGADAAHCVVDAAWA